jgi:adenine C2-methylase RlmN of 23S rRNA A2503 and tRNA A37
MWAVTPLLGVNDSLEDAEALAEMALEFTARTDGLRPRISLVPYNTICDDDPYQRVPIDKEGKIPSSRGINILVWKVKQIHSCTFFVRNSLL